MAEIEDCPILFSREFAANNDSLTELSRQERDYLGERIVKRSANTLCSRAPKSADSHVCSTELESSDPTHLSTTCTTGICRSDCCRLIQNLSALQALVGSVVHIAEKSMYRVVGSVIISEVRITKSSTNPSPEAAVETANWLQTVKMEPADEPFLTIELRYSASLKSPAPPSLLAACIRDGINTTEDKSELITFFRYGSNENDTVCLSHILCNEVLRGQQCANSELIEQIVLYRSFAPHSPQGKCTVGLDPSFRLNLTRCAELVTSNQLSDAEWITSTSDILRRLTSSNMPISDFLTLDRLTTVTNRKRARDDDELHTLTTVRRVAKERELEKFGRKRKRRRQDNTMFMHLMDVRAYVQDELDKHVGDALPDHVAWPPDEYRYPLTTVPVGDSSTAYSIVESWHYRLGMDEDVFNFREISREDLACNGCISLQEVLGKIPCVILLSEWVFYIRESIYPVIFDDNASLNEVLHAAMNGGKLDKQGSGPVANLCFLPAKMLVDGSPVLKKLYEDFVYRISCYTTPCLIHEPSNFFVDLPSVRKQRRTLLYDNLFDRSVDHRDRYSGFVVLSCESGANVIDCLVNAHKVRRLMREFYHPSTGYEAYRLKDFGNTKPQQLSSAHFDIDEFNNFALVYARMIGRLDSTYQADVSHEHVIKYQDFCRGLPTDMLPEGPIKSWLPVWVAYALEPRSIFLWNNKCPVRYTYKPTDSTKPLIGLELDYQPIDPSANGSLTQPWYAQRMKRLMSYKVRSDRSTKIQNRWEWPMVCTLKKRQDGITQQCRLAHGPYTLYLFDKYPQYYQGLPNRNIDVLRGFQCHKDNGTIFSHKDYYESLNRETI